MEDGMSRALALFKKTAREVPAYRDFLRRRGVSPRAVRGATGFKALPPMEKKSYLYRYPFAACFPKGIIPPMAYASSGSSGAPTFWFRGDQQEETGTDLHERIFKDIFGIRKSDRTLVVICFSMGIWVAGGFTLAACRRLSDRGYGITTATPGIEMDDVLDVLRRLAPAFGTVVLVGYPPFVMDVLTRAKAERIRIPRNTRLLTSGDKFSEEWRDAALALLQATDPLRTIVSVYGSADAGPLGYETPLAIAIRRAANGNAALRERLFGREAVLPALVQYDPDAIFFESLNGELHFTTDTAAPLIRYNIHDIGKVLDAKEMRSIIRECSMERSLAKAGVLRGDLPFIIKGGRNDVAVTFYALNIYPENIKAGLSDPLLKRAVSGQFFAFNRDLDGHRKQKFFINVELAKDVRPRPALARRIERTIIKHLLLTNIEFRKLHEALGTKAFPVVRVFAYGHDGFRERGTTRGLIGLQGKKVKIFDPVP